MYFHNINIVMISHLPAPLIIIDRVTRKTPNEDFWRFHDMLQGVKRANIMYRL